jgi:hypothetical protein
MVRIMRILLCCLLFVPSLGWGLMYPVMTSMDITRCKTNPSFVGECNTDVYYRGTAELLDIAPVVAAPSASQDIQPYGIHCGTGDAASNTPYSACSWTQGIHVPLLTGPCRMERGGSWELTATSTCTINGFWGGHLGAAPGGECVIFGVLFAGNYLQTPYGYLTAEVVANAGSAQCVKPLPPDVVCDVSLPGEISHGDLLVGASGIAYVDGTVDCGSTPVVTVIGGTDLTLAAGVSTRVTTTVSNATALRVQSDMTVDASATPGNYSAAIVIAVSPY